MDDTGTGWGNFLSFFSTTNQQSNEPIPSTENIAIPLTTKQQREEEYKLYKEEAQQIEDFSPISSLNIVYLAGYDKSGRRIVVVEPKNLDPKTVDFKLLLLYSIYLLDPIVENEYSLLFIDTDVTGDNRPPIDWLLKFYSAFHRNYKKNMKTLFIIHPKFWIKMTLNLFNRLISSKFWKKVSFVENVNEIYETIEPNQIKLPNYVIRFNAKAFPPPPVFGSPLKIILTIPSQSNNPEGVPTILLQCRDYLKNHYDVEGIFRLSGSDSDVKQIIQAVNNGETVDFSNESFPHTIASVFKQFFRQLPDKILSDEYFDPLLSVYNTFKDMQEFWILKTGSLLSYYPEPNKRLIKLLFDVLGEIAARSDVNKMSPSNLALVFAPNVVPTSATIESIGIAKAIIERMIICRSQLFGGKFVEFK